MEKKICAVGDVILMESLPDDYDLQALKDIICQADMKLFNQTSSLLASVRAIYSASVVEKATLFYSLDIQLIAVPLIVNT